MLDLTHIEDECVVKLFHDSDDDKVVAHIWDSLTFNNIRLQICQQNLSGYYIYYEGKRYDINRFGALENWPNTLFTKEMNIVAKLLQTAAKRRKAEKEKINNG